MAEQKIYKVVFANHGQIYEIYAKNVYQGDLYGFVVVEDLIFGENTSIVIDPAEEKLKIEFDGVKRSFLPMHEILRIDQVERRGTAKILSLPNGGHLGHTSRIHTPERK